MNKQHTALALAFPLLGAALLVTPAASAQPSASARYRPEIVSAIRRDLPSLRACYEGARTEGRAAWRSLREVRAVVGPDGRINTLTLDGGHAAPRLDACVRPIANAWRLSPPAGGAPVTLVYSRAEIQRVVDAEHHHRP